MTAPADETRTGVQRQLDAVLTIYRCPICGARNSASRSDVEDGFGRCADHGVYRRAAASPADTDDIDWSAHRGSCRLFYAERRCTCGAAPDPRFRDQLAEVVDAHGVSRRWLGGVDCRCGWFGREAAHAAHIARALLPLVEARVQAAEQRAMEERVCAGGPGDCGGDPACPVACPYARAAALASPAPAPRAEEGQR